MSERNFAPTYENTFFGFLEYGHGVISHVFDLFRNVAASQVQNYDYVSF